MIKSNYKVYNGKKIKNMLENSKIYFFLLLLIGGLIIGALSSGKNNEILKSVIENYIIFRKSSGFSNALFKSIAVNSAFILLSVFFSFSLIGSPFIYMLLIIKGLGIGAISGYLYCKYGIAGVGYSALTLYPSLIISSFALIKSCRESDEYSKNSFEKAIRGRGQFETGETKIFLARQIIILIITVFACVIDALFVFLFGRFFSI